MRGGPRAVPAPASAGVRGRGPRLPRCAAVGGPPRPARRISADGAARSAVLRVVVRRAGATPLAASRRGPTVPQRRTRGAALVPRRGRRRVDLPAGEPGPGAHAPGEDAHRPCGHVPDRPGRAPALVSPGCRRAPHRHAGDRGRRRPLRRDPAGRRSAVLAPLLPEHLARRPASAACPARGPGHRARRPAQRRLARDGQRPQPPRWWTPCCATPRRGSSSSAGTTPDCADASQSVRGSSHSAGATTSPRSWPPPTCSSTTRAACRSPRPSSPAFPRSGTGHGRANADLLARASLAPWAPRSGRARGRDRRPRRPAPPRPCTSAHDRCRSRRGGGRLDRAVAGVALAVSGTAGPAPAA